MHQVVIGLTVFGLVFAGELPDKTAIACLVLGARYRATPVLAGAWSAFVVHVVLAVVAGGLIARLPRRPVELVTSALFLVGAVVLARSHGAELPESQLRTLGKERGRGATAVAATAFGVVLVAEFGDVTQILTASLAARYDEPLPVAVGAIVALWSVAAIAVVFGHTLLRFLPLNRVQRLAAVALVVLAVVSAVAALR